MKPDPQRIESLIEKAESLADPDARTCALELLQSLMELHGACLERLMQIVSQRGAAGQDIQKAFVSDEAVSGLLLLYGLHPAPIEDRVRQAVEKLRSELHGEQIELASIESGIVRLRVTMNGHSCQSANVRRLIETVVIEAAPDVSELIIDEVAPPPKQAFVPLLGLSPSKAAVGS